MIGDVRVDGSPFSSRKTGTRSPIRSPTPSFALLLAPTPSSLPKSAVFFVYATPRSASITCLFTMSGPFDKSAKKPIDVSVQRNVKRNCEEEEEERRSYAILNLRREILHHSVPRIELLTMIMTQSTVKTALKNGTYSKEPTRVLDEPNVTPTDQWARWAELRGIKAKCTPILLQLRPRVGVAWSNLRLILDGLAREIGKRTVWIVGSAWPTD